MLFSDPTDDNGMMQIFSFLNNYMKLFKTIPTYLFIFIISEIRYMECPTKWPYIDPT